MFSELFSNRIIPNSKGRAPSERPSSDPEQRAFHLGKSAESREFGESGQAFPLSYANLSITETFHQLLKIQQKEEKKKKTAKRGKKGRFSLPHNTLLLSILVSVE